MLVKWNATPYLDIPDGKRWRMPRPRVSHEISAVFQRFKMYKEGYLTVEERLTRWGLVMWTFIKIQEFMNDYSNRSDEWKRILLVLDVSEEDVMIMVEFTNRVHRLHSINYPIPIRVLEVIAVFRLSLRHFKLTYTSIA
jgi:hypothetical protein